jgi:signal transduction histidine kinase
LTAFQLVTACVEAMVALVWATLALDFWRVLRTRRPRSPIYRLLPVVTGFAALLSAAVFLFILTPTELDQSLPGLRRGLDALIDLAMVGLIASCRHLAPLMAVREDVPGPGRRWLAAHYGTAAVFGALALLSVLVPGRPALRDQLWALQMTYFAAMGLLALRDVRRLAHRGAWLPTAFGEMRQFDVAMITVALVGPAGLILLELLYDDTVQHLLVRTDAPAASVATAVLHVVSSLAFASLFAVRALGRFSQQFPLALVTLGATAGVYFGVHALTARLAGAETRRLVGVVAVLGLFLVLGPGQAWVRTAIDRLVSRRSRRRWAELQIFLHGVSPELGVVECCRRVVAEVRHVMRLRGAALLLADGEVIAHGAIAVEPLARAWPRGGEVAGPVLGAGEGRDLPLRLREALIEANVATVLPIVSPRRRWGDLFLSAGLMGAPFGDEDIQAVEAFANQLGLLLDGAELLARAVGVERSLAHAEKLAAIGELTARVVHEIRNPVTAARSLAQQLARAPAPAEGAESAGLILAELERVEERVAALLRFARREELRLEPVDLGELAAATVAQLRPRLDAAGVETTLDTATAVVARADREKLRQVLINLVENAIDALRDAPGARRLRLVVASANGTATLTVADTGPGVPAEALPHLFEPFFSLKATGTGLGLAIAQRTVEAQGGRIEATQPPAGGLTFDVALPLAEAG